ncbi:MAG: hypothetical protein DID92_2727744178 [Candidatus Nitrotoga sp. SPKER]|nr:MAG: hypothetical protein DID92_2727744178 [Candidatus Nitrotoga sp. SPKER]
MEGSERTSRLKRNDHLLHQPEIVSVAIEQLGENIALNEAT